MAKPYDATTKALLTADPAQLLAYLGLGDGHDVEVLNVDLSTITTESDGVLHVADPEPWLAHVEFQISYERGLGRRLLRYNVLIGHDRDLPVRSVVLLLRPEADGSGISGRVECRWPTGDRYLDFHYDVVRAWEQPVETILEGGLGMLPLAPVSAVARADLPALILRIRERLAAEATTEQAKMLWASTYILMGLQYTEPEAAKLLQGVRDMEDSVTYQAILRRGVEKGRVEGREEGERQVLIRVGEARFGEPDDETRLAIEAMIDLDEIVDSVMRIPTVSAWKELLQGK